jgi:hypothetical protein
MYSVKDTPIVQSNLQSVHLQDRKCVIERKHEEGRIGTQDYKRTDDPEKK